MSYNFLFINNHFSILGGNDCGASVRSTVLIEALAHIGKVDIINYSEKKISKDSENCNIIYENHISDENPATHQHNLSTRIQKYIKPFNPQSHFTINREKESIIDAVIHSRADKNPYDYVVCRYISEAVTCGLLKYADRLIVDVDDNPFSETLRTLAHINPWQPWKYITGLYRAISVNAMTNKILDKICISFHSNKIDSPHKSSIYLNNVPGVCHETTTFTCIENHKILIVGWIDYAPNKYGITRFVKRIFPEIRKVVPDTTLNIAGKTKDETFFDWLNSNEGVNALGFVEDLQNEYNAAQVVVIPLYHGSGTSVKFTEAMSMGKPIVSTKAGVRGFDDICKENVHYLCAKTDKDFAQKIIYLLTSPAKCEALSINANNVAKDNISKDHFFDTVEKAICRRNI